MEEHPAASPEQIGLIGGGETGDLIRRKDWSATPLGPIESWPAALKANVQTVLSSPVAMVVLWGPDGILIYNDAYASVCGPRHPPRWAQGCSTSGRKRATSTNASSRPGSPANR